MIWWAIPRAKNRKMMKSKKLFPQKQTWHFRYKTTLWRKKTGDHSEIFSLFELFCGTPPSCLKVVCWVGVWANQIKTLYYWRFEMTQRLTTYTQFFDRKLVQYCRLCISRNVLLHLVFQKSLYCQSINQQQNDNVEIRHFKIWLWNTFSAPVHSK